MADRLFEIDDYPEIPLLRERSRKGAAAGSSLDARFLNDYPPQWHRCPTCVGTGHRASRDGGKSFAHPAMAVLPSDPRNEGRFGFAPGKDEWEWIKCEDCLGMGSLKARVRLEARHRCIRCKHPYVPKGDAKTLGVEPSWRNDGWSPCDEGCKHGGPMRVWTTEGWTDFDPTPEACGAAVYAAGRAEAQWRILTVHHLDGDKANCRWWNLAALCQRCHLEIQAKVVMERIYPHEHSEWFKPYVAGYYAFVYLGDELARGEVGARLDELLALELVA